MYILHVDLIIQQRANVDCYIHDLCYYMFISLRMLQHLDQFGSCSKSSAGVTAGSVSVSVTPVLQRDQKGGTKRGCPACQACPLTLCGVPKFVCLCVCCRQLPVYVVLANHFLFDPACMCSNGAVNCGLYSSIGRKLECSNVCLVTGDRTECCSHFCRAALSYIYPSAAITGSFIGTCDGPCVEDAKH